MQSATPTGIYTYVHPLSLHAALPISISLCIKANGIREPVLPRKREPRSRGRRVLDSGPPLSRGNTHVSGCSQQPLLSRYRHSIGGTAMARQKWSQEDRKSTRLNSSH